MNTVCARCGRRREMELSEAYVADAIRDAEGRVVIERCFECEVRWQNELREKGAPCHSG